MRRMFSCLLVVPFLLSCLLITSVPATSQAGPLKELVGKRIDKRAAKMKELKKRVKEKAEERRKKRHPVGDSPY